VNLPELKPPGNDIRFEILLSGLMEMETDMRVKEELCSRKVTRAKSKSSSAFLSHSLTIPGSTIEDRSLFHDHDQKRIPHFKPILELFRTVNKQIDRDISVDHSAQLADPVGAIERGLFLDDEEVRVAVNVGCTPDDAAEKNDLFRFIFQNDLLCDVFDFLLKVSSHRLNLYGKGRENIQ
jgi:hypothetical protein